MCFVFVFNEKQTQETTELSGVVIGCVALNADWERVIHSSSFPLVGPLRLLFSFLKEDKTQFPTFGLSSRHLTWEMMN